MNNELLTQIFMEQIAFQCRTILVAAREMDNSEANDELMETWVNLQAIVQAAGNISKLLWSKGSTFKRQPLRDALGVNEQSPLKILDVRNHFEHIDEKFIEYYDGSSREDYVDLNIGPKGFFNAPKGVRTFRHYDDTTGIVSFWEYEIDIRGVITEAQRVLPLCAGLS